MTSIENGSAGTPTITVAGADGVSASVEIPVYNFDIYYNDSSVTGKNCSMSATNLFNANTFRLKVIVESGGNPALTTLGYAWGEPKHLEGAKVSCSISWSSGAEANLKIQCDYSSYEITVAVSSNGTSVANISFTRTK